MKLLVNLWSPRWLLFLPLQRKVAEEQFQDLIEGLELQERSAERKAAEQDALRQKEELYKVKGTSWEK